MAIQNSTPFVRHVGGTEGTTGWSKSDVLNAVEQVLADAGIHGSSERKGGVVVNCLAPGSLDPYNYGGYQSTNWKDVGPRVRMPLRAYRQIRVTNNGNSNYVLTPIWQPASFATDGGVYFDRVGGGDWQNFTALDAEGYTLDEFSGIKHDGWQTGDSFILRNPSGDPSGIPPELTVGNTYYMIVPSVWGDISNGAYPDTIKIADSLANANAGTAITFASTWSQTTSTSNADINLLKLEFEFPAVTKVTVRQDDSLTFHLTSLTGHPTTIVDTADTTLTFPGGTYDDSRELKLWSESENKGFRSLTYRGMPEGLGLETGRIHWSTRNWTQGKYALQCTNHAAMNNVIEVLPSVNTYENGYNAPYWDYEVPASGGREACTFRVYRRSQAESAADEGKIEGIRIQTPDAKGWSNDEVFVIPGTATGGTSPKHDITFGVNSWTTQQQADDNAVPSVQVMDVGSGTTNFWARYDQLNSAFIEIENDANKAYGTTYYGIKLNPANNYELQIGAGVEWKYLNWNPTTTIDTYEGVWGGNIGMDKPTGGTGFGYNDSWYAEYSYGIGSNATSYPMKVQVWKANANDPQDPNFYVLQFVQNVAGDDTSTLSLYFHKGTVIGNGIWDLDHVWQGGITRFIPTTYQSTENIIQFETHMPRNYRAVEEEKDSNYSIKRCAEYGYFREANLDGSGEHAHSTHYANNIYTDNAQGSEVVKLYFRDSAVDKTDTALNWLGNNPKVDIAYDGGQTGTPTGGDIDYTNSVDWYFGNKADVPSTTQVASGADYYKPIKGIPLQNCWAPIPYYLPDDWVIIPFNVTPGATTFHTGDSITVSASEIYKIIEVSYTVNQKTFDGITSNSCRGIAFCARTT